jgi:lipopolysaccharide biosynthesis protein
VEVRREPFVEYLTTGSVRGPWQDDVLDVSREGPAFDGQLRVALHIHAHYPELFKDVIERFARSQLRGDLFVSTSSDEATRDVTIQLKNYTLGRYEVRTVPNRGRDIAPFASEFARSLLSYDVVGHFHTKKSAHVQSSNLVSDWINFLMENLLGNRYPSAHRILASFAANPELGLVFADDPHLIGWDKNRPFAETISERIGIEALPSEFFNFPVGTMFWARPKALQPLFDLKLALEDYPREPIPIDGTMLHAIERMLPSIVRHAGFRYQVTYAPGVSR